MNGKLAVGNWKMNLFRDEARELSGAVADAVAAGRCACGVVLAPPFTSLDAVRDRVSGSGVGLAAQNVSHRMSGALTGEVSAQMLADAGCGWAIVGHSERRHILGETDERIREKVSLSLSCGLGVILCVGETEAERDAAESAGGGAAARKRLLFSPISSQMESALSALDEKSVPDIVIAYEPVWAIGTGKNAASSEIAEMHLYIRELLAEMFPVSSDRVRILYGGSVKTGNIDEIMSVEGVDGVLVGGASLSAGSFLEIAKSVGG